MSAEQVPNVQQAWAAVMHDVQALGKHQRHDSPGARFNFRGVDDVMNAVGPALRTHGVSVVPTGVQLNTRATQTSTGKATQEATVMVTYAIHGPAGDSMAGGSAGGAMDSGDKGVAKAMSVAFRTFLLQSLCLPTDEPDPDAEAYERASAPVETPAQAALRGIAQAETTEALDQVVAWADRQGLSSDTEVVRAVVARREALAMLTPGVA